MNKKIRDKMVGMVVMLSSSLPQITPFCFVFKAKEVEL